MSPSVSRSSFDQDVVVLPRGITCILESSLLVTPPPPIHKKMKAILYIVAHLELMGTAGPQQVTSLEYKYVQVEEGDAHSPP